jgi:hypothetical protein
VTKELTARSAPAHAWSCADWLVRERLPTWMELAGETRRARAIRRLAPLTDPARADAAATRLVAARRACEESMRREAAWDAVWQTRLANANRAATAAAAEVASAPVWLQIREAANDVAWDAARDAIGDMVWDCTWAVAWDAAWDADPDDARHVARAALAATAGRLEESARELLRSNTLPAPRDHPRGDGTYAQGA